MKWIMLGAAAAALLGGASPALAQDAAPAASSGADDIVITANRRSESVQSSSLAIQVLSASAIQDAGLSQANNLTAVTPGVQIGQGGPATQVYIRGVGDFGSTPITNPSVATNVDGVYVSRSQSIEGNFYDLARIEVLKGPQGTLYGRNASGGALNIISQAPTFDDVHGYANVEIGNYNLLKTEGALNVPLTDSLAVRGAFQIVSRDGYGQSGFDDDKHQSGRFQALYRPNDNFSLRWSADWSHIGGVGPGYYLTGDMPPTVAAAFNAQFPGAVVPGRGDRVSVQSPEGQLFYFQGLAITPGRCIPQAVLTSGAGVNGAPVNLLTANPNLIAQGQCPAGQYARSLPGDLDDIGTDNTFWNTSAELTWNLGFATLTVLPAYRNVDMRYTTFPSGNAYRDSGNEPDRAEAQSLEIRLASDEDWGHWVVGAYGFDEFQKQRLRGDGGLGTQGFNVLDLDTTSWAVFGQTTFNVTDTWRLIAGARYSEDDRSIAGSTNYTSPSVFFLDPNAVYAGGVVTHYATPALAATAASAPGAVRLTTYGAIPSSAGTSSCYNGPAVCVNDAFAGQRTFTSLTWKIGTEYDLTPDSMLFFTIATGYKSGGFNSNTFQGSNGLASSYRPELLTAYELGSRNRFFDGRVTANFEAFYWEYRDHQETFSQLDQQGIGRFAYANAGSATMYGIDFDLAYRPTSNDVFRFAGEAMHTNFDVFQFQTSPVAGVTTSCGIIAGTPLSTVDCSGNQLLRSPEWSGSASYEHTFDLASGATIGAKVESQFGAERWLAIDFLPADRAPSYITSGASLTYTSADGDWSVAAWGRNLNNADVFTGAIINSANNRAMTTVNMQAPRTYGVRLKVNF